MTQTIIGLVGIVLLASLFLWLAPLDRRRCQLEDACEKKKPNPRGGGCGASGNVPEETLKS